MPARPRRYFEEIEVGEEYESPGRTVTESDIVLFDVKVTFGNGLGKTDTVDVRVRYTPPTSNRLQNLLGRPASLSFETVPR